MFDGVLEGPPRRLCGHCAESIEASDYVGTVALTSDERPSAIPLHGECFIRLLVGGVNHMKGICHCTGGAEPPDPPWMTKREAALAAFLHYHDRLKRSPRAERLDQTMRP